MPRVGRFSIASVADLCRQLMYAPAAARRRHMEAAERLAAEIEPARVYPRDFVTFRVTGYRPEGSEPQGLVGAALVGDLAAMVQRLSRSLELAAEDDQRAALPLDQAAAGLGVCTRTLQRYRRRGLVCHYVVFPDGIKRLAVYRDVLDRFVECHGAEVRRAAGFSRIDDASVEVIIADATAQRVLGLSRAAAARRLAPRFGRSPETLRQLLLRRDRAAEPGFDAPGAIGLREARAIWRAARRGVPVALLAGRFGKSVPSIHRSINRARRTLLQRLHLRVAEDAGLAGPAAEALLDEPQVCRGLPVPAAEADALALIEFLRAAVPHDPADEARTAAAHHLLRWRAAQGIDALPAYPASARLDRVETDLRWADLLAGRLVGWALPAALRVVEQFLGRRLEQLPSEVILAHLRRAIAVAAGVAVDVDPRRQRLATRCAFAMGRDLAAGTPPGAGRAATRHRPGALVLAHPFDRICPWQRWLGLPAGSRARVAGLDEPLRRLVCMRYGLEGSRPMTLGAIGAATGRSAPAAARLIGRAEAALRVP